MNLAKHYDALTANERLRLYIAAAARRDKEEMETLDATCPRKLYRVAEAEYEYPKDKIAIMTLAYHGDMNRYATKVFLLLAVLLAAGEDSDDSATDKADEAVQHAISRYLAMSSAWQSSCEQHGFDPKEVAEAHGVQWGDMQADFINSLAEQHGVEENEATLQESLEVLERMWQ